MDNVHGAEILNEGIGYLRISQFGRRTGEELSEDGRFSLGERDAGFDNRLAEQSWRSCLIRLWKWQANFFPMES